MKNTVRLLIYFLKKDIKAKYAGSGLGMVWTVLMPLLQILLFWFVFSTIMKSRPYATTQIPYIYFLLSSFFFWLAFSEGLIRASNTIIENAEMVKKVSFPIMILPITVTLSSYVHHLVGFLIFILFYSLATSFSPVITLVIPILFFQVLFSLGLGMLLSALLPYIRDLSQITGYAMQGLFFLSPIIYSMEAIPERFKILFYLNPVTYFASSYHTIILFRDVPPLSHIGIILSLSLGSLLIGAYTFRKLRDGFPDVL
jgi:ABC-type polysaccharide/polyol phosphate export permease